MKKDRSIIFSFLQTCARYLKAASLIVLVMLLNSASARAQSNSLVIAVEDDAAPWSRADGTGYANDVVSAAFKAVGVDVELRVVPYARCKRMAIRGTAAGCFSMSPSPEFNGLIELSAKPLFTPYAGYFYNVNKPPQAKRQEDLPAKTVVGTVIGYEYPPEFERLVKAGIITLEESPSEVMNLKKLAAGRVDLALLTYDEMKSPAWLMTRAGVGDKVKTTFRAGALNSYIGFSLKHPQGAWALQQFNKGFDIITRNGALRRIQQMWIQKLAQEKPTRSR